MKDQRFIELVNLYIDRQISAAETTELETEIQGNPRRRAIYRNYCKMHRATSLVYESFRAEAGQQPAAAPGTSGTIAQFKSERRSRRYRWAYYASGLAAAACLALLFVRLSEKPVAAPEMTVVTMAPRALPAVETAAPVPPMAAPETKATVPAAMMVSLRNNTEAEPNYAAMLTAMRQEELRALTNGQAQPGRMTSLFEDGVFDSQQFTLPANQRTFRGRQSPAEAQTVSFQFQR